MTSLLSYRYTNELGVLVVQPNEFTGFSERVTVFPSEGALLDAFVLIVREKDPDFFIAYEIFLYCYYDVTNLFILTSLTPLL